MPYPPLVHARLCKRLNDVASIEKTATRGLSTAEALSTLNDIRVASQAGLLDAAQSSTALTNR